MHHFAYRAGVMHAEGVSLATLAESVGTPFYCYSTATLERHYRVFAEAFADVPSLVCYAMKANSNQAVIATLAESVGTPFYCYSTATLERHYRVFAEAFADVPSLVCYAMKANSNQAVIATLARLGAGADVVSGGELKRALAAGVPREKIMFSGVGKTAAELNQALAEDILCIN